MQDKYNTCALSKHIGKYVYSARNTFLSLIHILPICFDSAQVYRNIQYGTKQIVDAFIYVRRKRFE